MSRATVRAAAALYLGGRPQPTRPGMYRDSSIKFLGTLWTSPPREVADNDYWPGVGGVSGAVATVHLVHSHERRESFGGGGTLGTPPAGEKRVDYQLYLECYFHSRQERSEDAMGDFDLFLDSLVLRMRADRTWGTGGRQFDAIWQAGEDIEISPGEPEVSKQRFYAETAVVTTVSEWVLS
jgi:hypothetical protein